MNNESKMALVLDGVLASYSTTARTSFVRAMHTEGPGVAIRRAIGMSLAVLGVLDFWNPCN